MPPTAVRAAGCSSQGSILLMGQTTETERWTGAFSARAGLLPRVKRRRGHWEEEVWRNSRNCVVSKLLKNEKCFGAALRFKEGRG